MNDNITILGGYKCRAMCSSNVRQRNELDAKSMFGYRRVVMAAKAAKMS